MLSFQKHVVLNVGQDLDGNFFNDHIDFYMCFGSCHTQKGIMLLAVMLFFLYIGDMIIFTAMKLVYIMPIPLVAVPLLILLVYGIKKNKRKLMLPYFIYASFLFIGLLILMVFSIFVVFYPKNFMFRWVMQMFAISNYDTALVMLLSVIVMGIDMIFIAWTNWSLYIHYCFLRGIEMDAEKFGREPNPNEQITSMMGIPCDGHGSFKII